MTTLKDFLIKSHNIQERFNNKGEFIRDNPNSTEQEPNPKDNNQPGSNRVPNMTYAERQRRESSKTPEQIEQEKRERMELARRMLQNP